VPPHQIIVTLLPGIIVLIISTAIIFVMEWFFPGKKIKTTALPVALVGQ
jgi:hypothetical protein